MTRTRPDVQFRVAISDSGHVGRARRTARRLAESAGFGPAEAERISLATAEAASNIAVHAVRGDVLLSFDSTPALELLALDRGPGLRNVAQCMTDGYSTAGTAGLGLGAIERLSDRFSIHSSDKGLVLWAAFGEKSSPSIGSVCVPVHGERACGDGWVWREADHTLIVIDGIGHGRRAEEACLAAQETFLESPLYMKPEALVMSLHAPLAQTRGAAVAVAQIDGPSRHIRFAGIGNISGTIIGPDRIRGLLSSPGFVGNSRYMVKPMSSEFGIDDHLIVHSDGIQSRWQAEAVRPALRFPSRVAAGLLFRDFCRRRDDATVVIVGLETLCSP